MAGRRRPTTPPKKSFTASSLYNLVQESQNIVMYMCALQMLQRRLMAFSLARYEKLNSPTKNACVCCARAFFWKRKSCSDALPNQQDAGSPIYYMFTLDWKGEKKSHHSYMFLLSFFLRIIHFTLSLRLFLFSPEIYTGDIYEPAATFRVDRTLPSLSKLRNHEVSTLIETWQMVDGHWLNVSLIFPHVCMYCCTWCLPPDSTRPTLNTTFAFFPVSQFIQLVLRLLIMFLFRVAHNKLQYTANIYTFSSIEEDNGVSMQD
jgi:hypothetical protein